MRLHFFYTLHNGTKQKTFATVQTMTEATKKVRKMKSDRNNNYSSFVLCDDKGYLLHIFRIKKIL